MTEIEDKLAIRDLMARYSFAHNFGDIEGYVECFTEDGVIESPIGTVKGSAAIRQYITAREAEVCESPLRYMVTNIITNVQGDRATGKCYLLILQVLREGVKLVTTGVYKDEFCKIDGTWRISHRKLELDGNRWMSQIFPAHSVGKVKKSD